MRKLRVGIITKKIPFLRKHKYNLKFIRKSERVATRVTDNTGIRLTRCVDDQ